ncbi:putative FAD linked oxidase, FAD-binding, type PCMH, subdomain 2 [Septoria linicola]|nr:putative FAD linked oxidase, FAD-binding, type PCMH, subdomain 2 [Septoria linicola]
MAERQRMTGIERIHRWHSPVHHTRGLILLGCTFHAALPCSIGATVFANHSCLPPDTDAYLPSKGCQLGGLPSYIVNATSPEQVATAAKWAAERNVRIVIKGTGHDLSMEGQAGLTLCLSGHAIFATFDVEPSGKYLGVTTPRM